MTGSTPQTILVVGAGIVGGSIGFHLARAGFEVTVVDQTGPHAGASGRSWAWINAMAAADRSYFDLRRAGMNAWRDLDQSLAGRLEIDWNGCLIWDPHLIDDDEVNESRRAWGTNVRMLDAADIRAELPALADGVAQRALLSPDDGFVDGAHATATLLTAARDHGARLVFGRSAQRLITNENGVVSGLETDFGAVNADLTVLAAGTGCRHLLAEIGFDLPIANRAGLLITTAPVPAGTLARGIWGSRVHVKQLRDGRLVIGDCVEDPNAIDDPETLSRRMLGDAMDLLPGIGPIEIDRTTIATRPIPGDGRPAIGPIPDRDGVYLATMHSGFTLAAITGKLAAAEINGDLSSPLLNDFRPGRFA